MSRNEKGLESLEEFMPDDAEPPNLNEAATSQKPKAGSSGLPFEHQLSEVKDEPVEELAGPSNKQHFAPVKVERSYQKYANNATKDIDYAKIDDPNDIILGASVAEMR